MTLRWFFESSRQPLNVEQQDDGTQCNLDLVINILNFSDMKRSMSLNMNGKNSKNEVRELSQKYKQ